MVGDCTETSASSQLPSAKGAWVPPGAHIILLTRTLRSSRDLAGLRCGSFLCGRFLQLLDSWQLRMSDSLVG
jgi:hypothetical protein